MKLYLCVSCDLKYAVFTGVFSKVLSSVAVQVTSIVCCAVVWRRDITQHATIIQYPCLLMQLLISCVCGSEIGAEC